MMGCNQVALISKSLLRRGILRAGDRILQINGHDVRNATQTDAVQLLKSCEEKCGLQIEYDVTVHGETQKIQCQDGLKIMGSG